MQPFDIESLRKQTKLEVLKLGARASLRSAIKPPEEWARLGFPVQDDDEVSSAGSSDEEEEGKEGKSGPPSPAPEPEVVYHPLSAAVGPPVAAAVQAAPEKKVIVEGGTQIPSLFSSKPFHSTKAKVKGAVKLTKLKRHTYSDVPGMPSDLELAP